MTDYAGNASGAGVPHTTIPLVDDSMPPTAMYFNPPLEALADNDAYRAAQIATLNTEAALIPHKLDGVTGGTYAPAAPIIVSGAGIVRPRNGLLDIALNGGGSSFNSSAYELYTIFAYQIFSNPTNNLKLNASTDPVPPTNGKTMRFTSIKYAAQASGYSINFVDTDSGLTILPININSGQIMNAWWVEFVYNGPNAYTTTGWKVSAWSSFLDGIAMVYA